jgi:hypothetical protein
MVDKTMNDKTTMRLTRVLSANNYDDWSFVRDGLVIVGYLENRNIETSNACTS